MEKPKTIDGERSSSDIMEQILESQGQPLDFSNVKENFYGDLAALILARVREFLKELPANIRTAIQDARESSPTNPLSGGMLDNLVLATRAAKGDTAAVEMVVRQGGDVNNAKTAPDPQKTKEMQREARMRNAEKNFVTRWGREAYESYLDGTMDAPQLDNMLAEESGMSEEQVGQARNRVRRHRRFQNVDLGNHGIEDSLVLLEQAYGGIDNIPQEYIAALEAGDYQRFADTVSDRHQGNRTLGYRANNAVASAERRTQGRSRSTQTATQTQEQGQTPAGTPPPTNAPIQASSPGQEQPTAGELLFANPTQETQREEIPLTTLDTPNPHAAAQGTRGEGNETMSAADQSIEPPNIIADAAKQPETTNEEQPPPTPENQTVVAEPVEVPTVSQQRVIRGRPGPDRV